MKFLFHITGLGLKEKKSFPGLSARIIFMEAYYCVGIFFHSETHIIVSCYSRLTFLIIFHDLVPHIQWAILHCSHTGGIQAA